MYITEKTVQSNFKSMGIKNYTKTAHSHINKFFIKWIKNKLSCKVGGEPVNSMQYYNPDYLYGSQEIPKYTDMRVTSEMIRPSIINTNISGGYHKIFKLTLKSIKDVLKISDTNLIKNIKDEFEDKLTNMLYKSTKDGKLVVAEFKKLI